MTIAGKLHQHNVHAISSCTRPKRKGGTPRCSSAQSLSLSRAHPLPPPVSVMLITLWCYKYVSAVRLFKHDMNSEPLMLPARKISFTAVACQDAIVRTMGAKTSSLPFRIQKLTSRLVSYITSIVRLYVERSERMCIHIADFEKTNEM